MSTTATLPPLADIATHSAEFVNPTPEPHSALGKDLQEAARAFLKRAPGSDMQETFKALANQWHKETGMLSSMSKKLQHPAYRRIIAMGEVAVPLILEELRDRPAHWFEALKAITKQTPVAPHERADFRKARAAWLKWGNDKGLI